MNGDGFRSRKFILSTIFTIAGLAGVFLGTVDGQGLAALAFAVLAGYGASNVAEKYVLNGRQDSR